MVPGYIQPGKEFQRILQIETKQGVWNIYDDRENEQYITMENKKLNWEFYAISLKQRDCSHMRHNSTVNDKNDI